MQKLGFLTPPVWPYLNTNLYLYDCSYRWLLQSMPFARIFERNKLNYGFSWPSICLTTLTIFTQKSLSFSVPLTFKAHIHSLDNGFWIILHFETPRKCLLWTLLTFKLLFVHQTIGNWRYSNIKPPLLMRKQFPFILQCVCVCRCSRMVVPFQT